MWRSGGTVPQIFNLSTRQTWVFNLTPGRSSGSEATSANHWKGSWVHSKASLEASEGRNRVYEILVYVIKYCNHRVKLQETDYVMNFDIPEKSRSVNTEENKPLRVTSDLQWLKPYLYSPHTLSRSTQHQLYFLPLKICIVAPWILMYVEFSHQQMHFY